MSILNTPRVLAVSLVVGAAAVAPGAAAASSPRGAGARQKAAFGLLRAHGNQTTPTRSENDGDLSDQLNEYAFERSLPAATVSGQALKDAVVQARQLPSTGGTWTEQTSKVYNSNPSDFTDPNWSNIGSGFAQVGGRVTSLVAVGDAWLAGTADGGIWRSTDQGQNWTPVFDSEPSLSIGALAVDPADGSVWVGTGEANTSQDSYAGAGVYRSTDGGVTWTEVRSGDGSDPVVGRTVFRIAFDGGAVLAATNNGLWRYDGTDWSEVLAPAPADDPQPYYDNQVTDVAVNPVDPSQVLTVVGWRGPLTAHSDNAFWLSSDGGKTYSKITNLTGDIDGSDIGRTTFAWVTDRSSSSGTRIYAIVESPKALAAGANSVLQGVFVSANGDPAGPWTKIADGASLSPGSATPYGPNSVGAQAWYNQDLAVDPANPDHVYAGLEEVFESSDGGTTWDTASPYWNYGLTCGASCPNTTHPDPHAMMITGGQIVIGNDGGVYHRPLSDTGLGNWVDDNNTLHNLQYYYARAGNLPTGGTAIWGGLQDNGTALVDPNRTEMVEPAGGDGFDVIVDPNNANRMVGEYTDGAMYSSTDGGHSFTNLISPSCFAQELLGGKPRTNCDPGARFVTPFAADQTNINSWVFGGQYVWTSQIGWKTKCGAKGGCTWGRVFNTGAGNAVTAVSEANGAIYAAWVGGGGNPGPAFSRGLATNVGGWHQISMNGLPNRFIAGVTVDKTNSKHAIIVFNGYSRRWIPGGGIGHVFETTNGGNSWTDISGDLPDIPGDAIVMIGGKLVLATDAGAFVANDGGGTSTSWSRLGTNLPNASVNDIEIGPNGQTVYAGTHGRGVWSINP